MYKYLKCGNLPIGGAAGGSSSEKLPTAGTGIKYKNVSNQGTIPFQ